jgi:hypothetical protein
VQKEMTNINASLHVLGNCVSALIEPGRRHIPYRDSILTRLLQNSLGGTGRTILIAAVRENINYREETYSTLQFANRASKIKMEVVAAVGSMEALNLADAHKQIQLLRSRITQMDLRDPLSQSLGGSGKLNNMLTCNFCIDLKNILKEMQIQINQLQFENNDLRSKFGEDIIQYSENTNNLDEMDSNNFVDTNEEDFVINENSNKSYNNKMKLNTDFTNEEDYDQYINNNMSYGIPSSPASSLESYGSTGSKKKKKKKANVGLDILEEKVKLKSKSSKIKEKDKIPTNKANSPSSKQNRSSSNRERDREIYIAAKSNSKKEQKVKSIEASLKKIKNIQQSLTPKIEVSKAKSSPKEKSKIKTMGNISYGPDDDDYDDDEVAESKHGKTGRSIEAALKAARLTLSNSPCNEEGGIKFDGDEDKDDDNEYNDDDNNNNNDDDNNDDKYANGGYSFSKNENIDISKYKKFDYKKKIKNVDNSNSNNNNNIYNNINNKDINNYYNVYKDDDDNEEEDDEVGDEEEVDNGIDNNNNNISNYNSNVDYNQNGYNDDDNIQNGDDGNSMGSIDNDDISITDNGTDIRDSMGYSSVGKPVDTIKNDLIDPNININNSRIETGYKELNQHPLINEMNNDKSMRKINSRPSSDSSINNNPIINKPRSGSSHNVQTTSATSNPYNSSNGMSNSGSNQPNTMSGMLISGSVISNSNPISTSSRASSSHSKSAHSDANNPNPNPQRNLSSRNSDYSSCNNHNMNSSQSNNHNMNSSQSNNQHINSSQSNIRSSQNSSNNLSSSIQSNNSYNYNSNNFVANNSNNNISMNSNRLDTSRSNNGDIGDTPLVMLPLNVPPGRDIESMMHKYGGTPSKEGAKARMDSLSADFDFSLQCDKHGLEQCILCQMFGGSNSKAKMQSKQGDYSFNSLDPSRSTSSNGGFVPAPSNDMLTNISGSREMPLYNSNQPSSQPPQHNSSYNNPPIQQQQPNYNSQKHSSQSNYMSNPSQRIVNNSIPSSSYNSNSSSGSYNNQYKNSSTSNQYMNNTNASQSNSSYQYNSQQNNSKYNQSNNNTNQINNNRYVPQQNMNQPPANNQPPLARAVTPGLCSLHGVNDCLLCSIQNPNKPVSNSNSYKSTYSPSVYNPTNNSFDNVNHGILFSYYQF